MELKRLKRLRVELVLTTGVGFALLGAPFHWKSIRFAATASSRSDGGTGAAGGAILMGVGAAGEAVDRVEGVESSGGDAF